MWLEWLSLSQKLDDEQQPGLKTETNSCVQDSNFCTIASVNST